LLHVIPVQALTDYREMYRDVVYTEEQILQDARRRIETLALELQPTTHTLPECSIQTGNVVNEILAAADRVDLLVVGADGSRSLRDLLIGTTTDRLLHKCRRPILISKSDARAPYRRVLVPVDFSVHSIASLRLATQLAPGADLLLFHAYLQPPSGELRLQDITGEALDRYHAERRSQALSNMRHLHEKVAAPAAKAAFFVECGDPNTVIAAKAAELGADLIVVGKHGHSWVAERFLGGVARYAVARAQCDVAVVPENPSIRDIGKCADEVVAPLTSL